MYKCNASSLKAYRQGYKSQPYYFHRYYETPREDDHQLCIWGVCWDDLIHPFSRRYTADSREYVFGMISASIIFFIGYGLVARPFW
ncbi:hypothetical protein DPMN_008656 [Dreissena polymorpha]|uniref:Uncharacterized protein n=1 Tax=Dreissena polymorpha TaxID=45954 RepID=A0A9D4RZD1_DREPO|nr:hypothetical protein DPMN_008656 [Dreissena polymorpha]